MLLSQHRKIAISREPAQIEVLFHSQSQPNKMEQMWE